MTEERFGQMIENAVEGAANKLDASLERKWSHKAVRVFTKLLSYAACLGLAIGAFEIKTRGYDIVAKICFITGAVGIIANIIMALVFRKH